jgi:hypothetical protein
MLNSRRDARRDGGMANDRAEYYEAMLGLRAFIAVDVVFRN